MMRRGQGRETLSAFSVPDGLNVLDAARLVDDLFTLKAIRALLAKIETANLSVDEALGWARQRLRDEGGTIPLRVAAMPKKQAREIASMIGADPDVAALVLEPTRGQLVLDELRAYFASKGGRR